eukprot:NODE_1234_length_1822_cov_52.387287_g1171_i0.p1 GENE.NODE_1234_length_1822_cov_52.387287_g1171_i0~~NODE_1234_length_1822_cov_52.387287_g1171_i0.p1  ORF type:complete len:119 (-),score=7.68 NODE_1234_length_1822_cov_52.387287_g1171_i0:515-871(-)
MVYQLHVHLFLLHILTMFGRNLWYMSMSLWHILHSAAIPMPPKQTLQQLQHRLNSAIQDNSACSKAIVTKIEPPYNSKASINVECSNCGIGPVTTTAAFPATWCQRLHMWTEYSSSVF